MAVTTSSATNAIWDAIVALLRAQMGTGGTLSSLLDVRKSAQFSSELVPAAFVQVLGFTTEAYSNRTRLATISYRVALAANSAGTTGRIPNLDDAMATLQPLVDDDAGNGVIPLLNAPANFGLGGLAQETYVRTLDYAWDIREGAGQIVWAYAVIEYNAVVQVRSS